MTTQAFDELTAFGMAGFAAHGIGAALPPPGVGARQVTSRARWTGRRGWRDSVMR